MLGKICLALFSLKGSSSGFIEPVENGNQIKASEKMSFSIERLGLSLSERRSNEHLSVLSSNAKHVEHVFTQYYNISALERSQTGRSADERLEKIPETVESDQ